MVRLLDRLILSEKEIRGETKRRKNRFKFIRNKWFDLME